MHTFIQDLHRLAKNCEYRTLRDDRIIIGVLDDTLSDRLQAKSDLTFTDAAHMSRQAKEIKQNWTIVRGVETQNEVDCISQPCSHNKQKATNNQPVRNWNKGFMKEPSKNDSPCFWCGRQNHDRK